jgi:NADPH-dependent curcumin reductase CurA
MSVDPYMRGRMYDRKSYAASFSVGEPLTGGCVGRVVASESGAFAVGDHVHSYLGWREFALAQEEDLSKIDPEIAPIQAYLGVMGMPGMTAYVGLLDIGKPIPGETVFVSAAAGAVGSLVCQIAKLKGCRVVGSAGSGEKVAWLLEQAGVDAAINYKTVADLKEAVGHHCPDGVDIYFENVGGEHLEAALANMNQFGRIPVCGMISQYNLAEGQPGPRNLALIIGKRLTLRGFIVSDHRDRSSQFKADMRAWIQGGVVRWEETVFEGLEAAPEAFIGLFEGLNMGKMLVKLNPA